MHSGLCHVRSIRSGPRDHAVRRYHRVRWVKDDSRNPTLSFKDQVVAFGAARVKAFGVMTLACARTGNLAPAVAAAAAAIGLDAEVFIPAGVGQDSAVVDVNLRPFHADGSTTVAYEIAQQLGWQTPDVVVAALASGSLDTKIARGLEELVQVGLIDDTPVRYVGGQAAGCGPMARAFAVGSDVVTPVERPDTNVRSLSIGSPADGPYALQLARRTGGSIGGVTDAETVDSMRLLARTVVLVITGNGLKTLAVLDDGIALPDAIAPSYEAFESWWESC